MIRIWLKRLINIVILLFVKYIIIVAVIAYSPKLQSIIAKYVTEFIINKFEIDLKIQKLYLKIPNKIVLNDILLKDNNGNILLQTDEINAFISKIKIFDKKIFIEKVDIKNPDINLMIDTLGNANYSFLFEKFSSDKDVVVEEERKSSGGFDIFLNDFNIIDANLKYKDVRKVKDNKEFNFSDIDISKVNLSIKDFKYYKDTIELAIKDFNFKEHYGLSVKELTFHVKYYNSGITLNDFTFETEYSLIKSSKINLIGTDKTYLSDPISKLSVDFELDTVAFDINDLSPFMPEYSKIHDKVFLSGKFTGKLSNIKLKDFKLSYGKDTRLDANISIDGLPDYKSAFTFGNIAAFTSSSKDIERILATVSPLKPIDLPSALKEMGDVSFTGNITGLLNDLVAYGQFKTGLGNLRTDLALVTNFDKKLLSFNGKLKATNIDLGKITGDTISFGLASLNTSLKGSIDSLSNFDIRIDGNVDNIEILDYDYTEIKINGYATNDSFDGELFVNDPNLQVEFLGKYNYGNKYQEQKLNFSTDIWANLTNLNILQDSLDTEIKFVMSTDLSGDLKDIPSGNIYISQLKFITNSKLINLDSFSLNINTDEFSQKYITTRSDYLDVNLYGNFVVNEIINVATTMIGNYIPVFVTQPEEIKLSTANNLNYDIRFKNLNTLLKVFSPKINVNNDIFIEGMFSGKDSIFNTIISVPELVYDSTKVLGNEIEILGHNDSINLKYRSNKISNSNFQIFENIDLNIDVSNNNIDLFTSWDNFDTIQNSGKIHIHTSFSKEDSTLITKMQNTIFPTEIIIHNRKWDIAKSNVVYNIEPRNLIIDNFFISQNNQSVGINGEISNNKAKILSFVIDNVDVSNINSLISKSGYQLHGTLSGNGRVADIFNSPSFRGFIEIEGLKANEEDLGDLELSANWDGVTKDFKIDGNSKYLNLKGFYTPKNDNIDVNLVVDNFKLDILSPYLNKQDISELEGTVDINIHANGNISEPDVDGYIKFTKAQLVYDYLKLKVTLDDKVEVKRDAFTFNNFNISDENKNTGVINGGIYHNNFSDMRFDFNIDARNMKLLNTTEKDNSSFFGTVYATANGKIYGDIDKLNIDVVAKTEQNTVLVIPMTDTYESGNVKFITFVKPTGDSINNTFTPINSGIDIVFKMDVEVTPSAEAQIVFDPKVGDLIKGYSKGNLKVEYNSQENSFNMYGDLEIEEGDYLFTLEDVINKRLTIKPGGIVSFTGDPSNAVIDLNAVYQTRAPLTELMEYSDSTENYSRAVSVECLMHMTGNLMSPEITFDIEIPGTSEKVKAQLASLTQDEKNRQIIFLLVMNRFVAVNQTPRVNSMLTTTGGATTFDLLSNQISNWMSQISKDFDFGFKYYPGSELSGQEVELIFSTQILNDRVLINGNFAYGDNPANNNSTTNSMLGGDIEVQLKLNKSGSFRIKGFSRANRDNIETEYGPYTSGAGIFYTKDFDTFKEIIDDFWRVISFKSFREKRKAKKEKEINAEKEN